ncbi:MAG: hypothetical protein U0822_20220 [Anaerolineae bacterium]
MRWTQRAEKALDDFLALVPDDSRSSMREAARRAAVTESRQAGVDVVDVDQVVLGLVNVTPAALRPNLRAVMQQAGLDVGVYQF